MACCSGAPNAETHARDGRFRTVRNSTSRSSWRQETTSLTRRHGRLPVVSSARRRRGALDRFVANPQQTSEGATVRRSVCPFFAFVNVALVCWQEDLRTSPVNGESNTLRKGDVVVVFEEYTWTCQFNRRNFVTYSLCRVLDAQLGIVHTYRDHVLEVTEK